MQPIKKILFPLDFSEVSPKVALWAYEMAKKFDAEIHLLFVAPTLEQFVGLYVPEVSIETFEGEVTRGAEARMEEFVRTHLPECTECRTQVALGDAAEGILNYIRSHGIDLVVMGTGGRKGIEKLLFGSVAEKVIKASPVPVLAVKERIGPRT